MPVGKKLRDRCIDCHPPRRTKAPRVQKAPGPFAVERMMGLDFESWNMQCPSSVLPLLFHTALVS